MLLIKALPVASITETFKFKLVRLAPFQAGAPSTCRVTTPMPAAKDNTSASPGPLTMPTSFDVAVVPAMLMIVRGVAVAMLVPCSCAT
jgi:hypothetical protein